MRIKLAFLAWLLSGAAAFATPARTTGWFADTAGPLTIASTAGQALCVFVWTNTGSASTLTISDNGSGGSSTYTPVLNSALAGQGTLFMAYALNINAATTLTVTPSLGTVAGIWVDEYSGVATSGALDGTGAIVSSSGTTSSSGTWTTAVNGDVLCGGGVGGGTPAVGAGFTIGNNDSTNGNLTEFQIQGAASASTAVTFTSFPAGNTWIGGFALKPTGAGGAATHSRMLMDVGP